VLIVVGCQSLLAPGWGNGDSRCEGVLLESFAALRYSFVMAFRQKIVRSEHVRQSSDERNVVRGHALFVRFMERKGLGDCVSYFPDSMTLGNLRSATPHELLAKYDIQDAADRERIMHIVDESHREDQSDAEVCVLISLCAN